MDLKVAAPKKLKLTSPRSIPSFDSKFNSNIIHNISIKSNTSSGTVKRLPSKASFISTKKVKTIKLELGDSLNKRISTLAEPEYERLLPPEPKNPKSSRPDPYKYKVALMAKVKVERKRGVSSEISNGRASSMSSHSARSLKAC